jgi:hypothetical protein
VVLVAQENGYAQRDISSMNQHSDVSSQSQDWKTHSKVLSQIASPTAPIEEAEEGGVLGALKGTRDKI